MLTQDPTAAEITALDVDGKAEDLLARVSALRWAWDCAFDASEGWKERQNDMLWLTIIIFDTVERDAKALFELALAHRLSLRPDPPASTEEG